MVQAVALNNKGWGKPAHLEDVLDRSPFLGEGNVVCREVADLRLTLLSRKSAAAKFQLIPGCFII